MSRMFKFFGSYLSNLENKIRSFLNHHLLILGLFLSVAALSLSGYNTYLLKTTGALTGNLPPTVNVPKLTDSEIEKFIKAGAPVLGNLDAKVTIIEFGDFQCPYCEKYFKLVLPEIKQKYIDTGKARFIYMSFAFLGEESQYSAQAAKCAQDQGKFWEYHDYLYNNHQEKNQGAFSPENLKKFAIKLGLNSSTFNECLDSKKYEKYITEETELGRKFGVRGTPGTFINDFFVNGTQGVSYFINRIDAALAEK